MKMFSKMMMCAIAFIVLYMYLVYLRNHPVHYSEVWWVASVTIFFFAASLIKKQVVNTASAVAMFAMVQTICATFYNCLTPNDKLSAAILAATVLGILFTVSFVEASKET